MCLKQSLATMKLLQGFHSEDAARELQLRMERAGIAILVTTPLKVRNADTGFTHLVFAALPSQHEDATQLLHQPDHIGAPPGGRERLQSACRPAGKDSWPGTA